MECLPLDKNLSADERRVLLNFSVSYILEKPVDIDEFGLRYFSEADAFRNEVQSDEEAPKDDDSVEIHPQAIQQRGRRNGIYFNSIKPLAKIRSNGLDPGQKLKFKLFMSKIFPFKYVDDYILGKIINKMIRVEVKAGDTVVRQGDDSRNFFIIESGIYREWVLSNGVESLMFRYNSWACFQQACLISPHPARVTITADSDGVLWALNCAAFRSILARYDNILYEEKLLCLSRLPYIPELHHSELLRLVDGMSFLKCKKGETILKNSAVTNGIYFVRSGKVCVMKKSRSSVNGDAQIAGPGDHFGDWTMFCDRLIGTHAVALESSEVIFLSCLAFERLLGPFGEVFSKCHHIDLKNSSRQDEDLIASLQNELTFFISHYKNQRALDILTFGCKYYPMVSRSLMSSENCKVATVSDKKPQQQGIERSQELLKNAKEDVKKKSKYTVGKQRNISIMKEPSVSVSNATYTVVEETSEGQRFKLKTILNAVPILKALGPEGINRVINNMQLVKVYPGHFVMKSDRFGQYFYVIEEGHFKTTVNGDGVKHEILECPNYFGELGLILDVPRYADIVATTNGRLWALSRQKFRQIADSVPTKRKGLNYKLVKNLRGLEGLREYDTKALSLAVENVTVKDREYLLRFHQDSCGVYFVKQGTVRVFSKTLRHNNLIVRPGGYFGFLLFSTQKSDSIKVQSIGLSKIARLSMDAFEKLLGHCRQVLYQNKCLKSN